MAYFGGTATERPWPRIDRTAVVLLCLFLAGVGAFLILATNMFQPPAEKIVVVREAPTEARPTEAEVLVAREALWPGQQLTARLFNVEVRSIVGIEEKYVKNLDELRGGYIIAAVAPNSPLLREQVTYSPPSNILTARIPEGFRAVAIPVDAESGVEGWARPGAHVDVVWTSKHRGKMLVTTIVENAQVLSAEHSTDAGNKGNANTTIVPTHVTLLVALKDAQKIQLAKASGVLSLNLRGDVDGGQAGSGTITVDSLLRSRDLQAVDEVQGAVTINGKHFVMKGKKLVPSEPVTE